MIPGTWHCAKGKIRNRGDCKEINGRPGAEGEGGMRACTEGCFQCNLSRPGVNSTVNRGLGVTMMR